MGAISDMGNVYTWGDANEGRVDHENVTLNQVRYMEKVLRLQATVTVLAVEGHSLAVTLSSRVFSWGFNNNGQGGIATATPPLLLNFLNS